jgi:hypothetical protein
MVSVWDRILLWLVLKISSAYLLVHRRSSYQFITVHRVLIRTLGRPLLRRVLDRSPLELPQPAPGGVCIHLLTKSNECLFALWACRSLLEQLDEALPLFVHDDGSLTKKDVRMIETALPGVRLVRRHEADALARHRFEGLPNCMRFREENILSLKLLDPWIVQETGDIVLLDSDVLIFRRPVELIHWLDHPGKRQTRWNMEPVEDGTIEDGQGGRDAPKNVNLDPITRVNCGFGFLKRELMNFETVEDLLSRGCEGETEWTREQALYRQLSSITGIEALPPTYHLADGSTAPPHSLVTKHYGGPTRGFFIAEGVWWILNQPNRRDSSP